MSFIVTVPPHTRNGKRVGGYTYVVSGKAARSGLSSKLKNMPETEVQSRDGVRITKFSKSGATRYAVDRGDDTPITQRSQHDNPNEAAAAALALSAKSERPDSFGGGTRHSTVSEAAEVDTTASTRADQGPKKKPGKAQVKLGPGRGEATITYPTGGKQRISASEARRLISQDKAEIGGAGSSNRPLADREAERQKLDARNQGGKDKAAAKEAEFDDLPRAGKAHLAVDGEVVGTNLNDDELAFELDKVLPSKRSSVQILDEDGNFLAYEDLRPSVKPKASSSKAEQMASLDRIANKAAASGDKATLREATQRMSALDRGEAGKRAQVASDLGRTGKKSEGQGFRSQSPINTDAQDREIGLIIARKKTRVKFAAKQEDGSTKYTFADGSTVTLDRKGQPVSKGSSAAAGKPPTFDIFDREALQKPPVKGERLVHRSKTYKVRRYDKLPRPGDTRYEIHGVESDDGWELYQGNEAGYWVLARPDGTAIKGSTKGLGNAIERLEIYKKREDEGEAKPASKFDKPSVRRAPNTSSSGTGGRARTSLTAENSGATSYKLGDLSKGNGVGKALAGLRDRTPESILASYNKATSPAQKIKYRRALAAQGYFIPQ